MSNWEFEEEQEVTEMNLRDAIEACAVGTVSREFVLANFGVDPDEELARIDIERMERLREESELELDGRPRDEVDRESLLEMGRDFAGPILAGLGDNPGDGETMSVRGEEVTVSIRQAVGPHETLVFVDASLGNAVVELPDPRDMPEGRVLQVRRTDDSDNDVRVVGCLSPIVMPGRGFVEILYDFNYPYRVVNSSYGDVSYYGPTGAEDNPDHYRSTCVEGASTECEPGREIFELICTLCGNMAVVTVDGGGFMLADLELGCACGGTAVPGIGDAPTE